MIFIYWGWDSAVSVNEETAREKQDARPGRRHSTVLAAGDLRARHRCRGRRSRASERKASVSAMPTIPVTFISVLGHAVFRQLDDR